MSAKGLAAFFSKTYGIGGTRARRMCLSLGVSPQKPWKTVSSSKREQGFRYLEQSAVSVGFPLQEQEKGRLLHEVTVGNLRSLRRKAFLPVNGQRSKTNGKTARRQAQKLLASLGKR